MDNTKEWHITPEDKISEYSVKMATFAKNKSSMPRQFGLVGYPLGHSFSKAFFSEKFLREGIDAEYLNFEIPDIGRLPDIIASHPALEGFNVTIPHKQSIIPMLTEIDPAAMRIGAVNVVKIRRDSHGKICGLMGFNTDITGFMESIRPHLRPHHSNALVLGSGGASKAIMEGLRRLGIEPVCVSRTAAPGRLTYADLSPEVMASHTVIVNTTPLGMHPHIDTCPPIAYESVGPDHLCFDAVYNPDPTLFLRRCATRGADTVSGISMLHLQALAAWHLWTD